eukprot:CAMPEP_0197649374 /NCGR_PEP_ID=MMETSP1338-20131121/28313_1 /TAXON_ID=43686 ORGANISM="Pelagodinium beii, Strain RCC1491" /NCGR_SAMPLE_ID=MMETSP1338 /ASSEMBLY_ACC=CAM_ASM_000754 /LENGTH=244 /DNA_ID=CAMNT_0043223537 /DNA_START=47 /DNA_END=781 /DNA_ORIENTATION=+
MMATSMLPVFQLILLVCIVSASDDACDSPRATALLQSSKQSRSGFEGDNEVDLDSILAKDSLDSSLVKADGQAAASHILKLLTEEQKVQAQNLEKVVGQQAGLASFQADKFAAMQQSLDAQEKKLEAEEKSMKQFVQDVSQQYEKLAKELAKKKEAEELAKKKEAEAWKAKPPNFEDVASLVEEKPSKSSSLESNGAEPEKASSESQNTKEVKQEHWYSSSWVKTVAGLGLLGLLAGIVYAIMS